MSSRCFVGFSLCECAAAIHVSKQESVMLIVDLFKHIIYYFGDNFATGCVSRCMKGKIQELGSSKCFARQVTLLRRPLRSIVRVQ